MENIAIVILNYNGRSYLEKFLPSVVANSGEARIVIADNASTDDSLLWLRNSGYPVEVIEIKSNLGYSGGYNAALSQVTADYYVLLNSDVEVTPGWLTALASVMEEHDSAAAVQPKILAWHNKNMFEYAGGAGGFIDKYGFPFCRGRLFDTFEEDKGQYNDTSEIFWASGACMMIRSNDFFEAGMLDIDFFAHMEEIDLCWRLHGEGKRVLFCGESTVYHVGGGTLKKSNPRKTYLNFRNGLSLLFKNLPGNKLWGYLMLRTFFDICAVLRFILLLQFTHAASVLKAHLYFWSHLGLLKKKRTHSQAHMRVDKIPYVYSGSIVSEYFLGGIRKFGELKKDFTG